MKTIECGEIEIGYARSGNERLSPPIKVIRGLKLKILWALHDAYLWFVPICGFLSTTVGLHLVKGSRWNLNEFWPDTIAHTASLAAGLAIGVIIYIVVLKIGEKVCEWIFGPD